MAKFDVADNVSVDEFFKDAIPKQFKDMIAGADMSALSGKEFKLQFNVDGKKYCLDIKNGDSVEIIEDGVEKPVLEISIGESDWRDAVTGKLEGVIDRFIDPSQLANAEVLATLTSTTGALNLELAKPDGAALSFSLIFNGNPSPEAGLNLALEDWVSMQKGETDGQALVMSGKMNFTGDMMFLMGLQSLM